MPNINAIHIDKALTNISIRHSNAAYVAETMFPVVGVAKESDKYFIYGKEHFAQHGTLRADGTESGEYNWTVSTASYSCEEYALHVAVTDREKRNADVPIKPYIDATETLTDAIKLDWEIRAQAEATAAASFATGHSAAASTQWDNSTGTVQSDVLTGQEVIRRAIARYPNTIFIPSRVAMYVAQNSTIQDFIKHTHSDLLTVGPGSWVLPPTLWGMKVVVTMSIKRSSNLGQAETLADVWDDTVILAYIAPSPGLKTLSWGYTFQTQGWTTKKWREEKRASDIVEVSTIRDLKVTSTSCAYAISDTISAANE